METNKWRKDLTINSEIRFEIKIDLSSTRIQKPILESKFCIYRLRSKNLSLMSTVLFSLIVNKKKLNVKIYYYKIKTMINSMMNKNFKSALIIYYNFLKIFNSRSSIILKFILKKKRMLKLRMIKYIKSLCNSLLNK